MSVLAPLDPRVARIAANWFHLPKSWEERAVSTSPVGLIVGEQPGPRSNPRLPMWPYPSGSAGGRLFYMSGMAMSDYLVRLARVNLMPNPVARWHRRDAMDRAVEITRGVGFSILDDREQWPRIVLCGTRAAEAFGLEPVEWFHPTYRDGQALVAVPHPSGRNNAYNDETSRRLVGHTLRWAARCG